MLPSPCSGAALVAGCGVAAPSRTALEDSCSGWMVPQEGIKQLGMGSFDFVLFFLVLVHFKSLRKLLHASHF